MSDARTSDLVRQLQTLFGSGVVAGMSDAELVERFGAQRATAEGAAIEAAAAFAVIVARHGPMVLGVCRRALSDANDVEDAFQATFLVLARRARSVHVHDSLGRWLYGVARRVAAKARARSDRDRVRSGSLEDDPVAPEEPLDRIGLMAALDEEVSRLPEKYRSPVVLCHLEGLSHAEAADRLRWPVGTVSGRLSRARDLLRNRLVRRGVAPGVALLAGEGARAAVPEALAAATVRAATGLAIGGGSPAAVASGHALLLMNEVLRAAAATKLKVAAGVVLAIAVAGVALGAGVRGVVEITDRAENGTGRAARVAIQPGAESSAKHRPADEIAKEIEAAIAMAAELLGAQHCELRLMPKVKDLSTLPTSGKRLVIVAEVDRGLYLRMFDLEGKMVLDAPAKRFTSTWVTYLHGLVPRLWPPHELTFIERISVTNAVATIAGRTFDEELQRCYRRIASPVGELRAVYPSDRRLGRFLPERWDSLTRLGQASVASAEIREVLETSQDPELRTSAIYFQTLLRFREPIDGRTAVSLAESFAAKAPGDKRSGELLDRAWHALGFEWSALVSLAVFFAVVTGLIAWTIGMARWIKPVLRVGVVVLAAIALAVTVLFFVANEMLIGTLGEMHQRVGAGASVSFVLSRWLGHVNGLQIRTSVGTIQAVVGVILAALAGVLLVVARRRYVEPPTRWFSAIRLGFLAFFAVLAMFCAVDAFVVGWQRNAIRERIVREYPGAFRGK